MPLTTAFVVYLILYRLAIIGAGITALALGYRLFVAGVWPETLMSRGSSLQVEFSGSRFTLKNAAPGTIFALCGVLMIGISVATGSPQLTMDLIQKARLVDDETIASTLTMRGEGLDTIASLTEQGNQLVKEGRIGEAIQRYEQALHFIAAPANHLAWLYLERGRMSDALPLSRLAVSIQPDDPNFLDTLAEILLKIGDRAEALRLMERASSLDPSRADKLSRFRERAR